MSVRIGDVCLLVYCECPCGNWIGNPEGGTLPKCRYCDGFYVPGGGPQHGDKPMYGESVAESRKMRTLGFVAFLTSENGAVRLLGRMREFLGLRDLLFRMPPEPGEGERLYTRAETQARSDEITTDTQNGEVNDGAE